MRLGEGKGRRERGTLRGDNTGRRRAGRRCKVWREGGRRAGPLVNVLGFNDRAGRGGGEGVRGEVL